MTAHFKPPTSEELENIIADIEQQFPHVAAPSSNPGRGETIISWMEENFGALDQRWTVINTGLVRFRELDDKIAFVLAWNSDWFEQDENHTHL